MGNHARVEERRCIRCGRTELHELDAGGGAQCILCRVLAEEQARAPVPAKSRRWLGLDFDDPVRVIGTVLILAIGVAATYSCATSDACSPSDSAGR